MEIARLQIGMKLPTLNEYIAKINYNKFAGNAFRQDIQEAIAWYIKASKIKPITKCVDLIFVWTEADRRRDPDNIYSAVKYILDALQNTNILQGDGQRHIRNIEHRLQHGEQHSVLVVFSEVE